MNYFETWTHDLWSAMQNPETAISVFAGLIVLSVLGAIAGFLTRKLLSLVILAALLYALMLYGDIAVIWFKRTF